jgi:hypothetical protein
MDDANDALSPVNELDIVSRRTAKDELVVVNDPWTEVTDAASDALFVVTVDDRVVTRPASEELREV